MEAGNTKRFDLSKKQWLILKNLLEKEPLSITSKKDANPLWTDRLEKSAAKRFKTKHAVSFNSCTSSIHSALAALGVKRGHQVIVSPTTCYTSVLPVLALGGVPIFCDIEYETLSISPKKLKKAINENTTTVLLPYVYGLPAKIKEIMKTCERNDLNLIEDCAHVPGLMVNGKPAGSFGNVGCFSFAQSKVLDCGEGGIAVTNDKMINEEMRSFKDGGKKAFRVYTPQGANYKMADYAAFLALNQLNNLEKRIKQRKKIAAVYFSKNWKYIKPANNSKESIQSVALFKTKTPADKIITALKQNGIDAKSIYKPLNDSNVFTDEKLLLQALQSEKKSIKQFNEFSQKTPIAKKAFRSFFYVETDPLKPLGFHKQCSKKLFNLMRSEVQ